MIKISTSWPINQLFNKVSIGDNFFLLVSVILIVLSYLIRAINPIFFMIDLLLVLSNCLLLISILNIRKSFLNYFYIFSIFVTLISPILTFFFGNPYYQVIFYTDALFYMYTYNLVFIIIYRTLISSNLFSNTPNLLSLLKLNLINNKTFCALSLWYEKIVLSKVQRDLVIFILFILSIISEAYLSTLGRFAGSQAIPGPFTQILTVLLSLKLFVFFYIARATPQPSHKFYGQTGILFLVGLVILTLGVLSGSRYEIVIFLILNLYLFYKPILVYKYRSALIGSVVIIFFIFLYEFMYFYRNSGLDISKSLISYLANTFPNIISQFEVLRISFLNIFQDRLNYLGPIQRVLDTMSQREGINFPYHQNIIGLIPRMIWEAKPVIGLNYNEIGISLGLIDYFDSKTSVNLHVVGESLFLLKYFYLAVAIFQAFLFLFVEKLNTFKKNPVANFLYFMLCIEICTTGTYVTIIPRILLISIFFLFLSVIFSKFKSSYV